jgi:rod shape-determining protein MreD
MIDFLSSGPFGLNCLIRTIIGFIAGLLNRTVNTSGFFIPMVLGFSGTLLKYLLLFLISVFFPNHSVYTGLFSNQGLFELITNTVLAPLVFWFLSLFNSYLLLENEQSE